MKQFTITFLFLCAFSVHLSAQDSDPCNVLSVVLDQVDEAVVQGKYDDALKWLENVKNNPKMRNCDKMKNGVVDYKIKDVKEKMARNGQKPTETTTSTNSTKPTSYKSCPDGNHPHLIDLGLPSGTKWACCNVDAKKPEDYGGYYAWGETTTKSGEYFWSSYKHCDGTKETCHNLGSSICGTQYDVAHVKWGGSWQLPSLDQVKELLDKCSKGEWTTQNGVKGRKFTGPNGASIFLPAAGYRNCSRPDYSGIDGAFLSGTQCPSSSYNAYSLGFSSGYAALDGRYRYVGRTVRPVAE